MEGRDEEDIDEDKKFNIGLKGIHTPIIHEWYQKNKLAQGCVPHDIFRSEFTKIFRRQYDLDMDLKQYGAENADPMVTKEYGMFVQKQDNLLFFHKLANKGDFQGSTDDQDMTIHDTSAKVPKAPDATREVIKKLPMSNEKSKSSLERQHLVRNHAWIFHIFFAFVCAIIVDHCNMNFKWNIHEMISGYNLGGFRQEITFISIFLIVIMVLYLWKQKAGKKYDDFTFKIAMYLGVLGAGA